MPNVVHLGNRSLVLVYKINWRLQVSNGSIPAVEISSDMSTCRPYLEYLNSLSHRISERMYHCSDTDSVCFLTCHDNTLLGYFICYLIKLQFDMLFFVLHFRIF